MHYFHTHEPEIKYVQDGENTCVFSDMYYYLFDVNENIAEHDSMSLISSSLSCDTVGYINMIRFASDIIIHYVINKG